MKHIDERAKDVFKLTTACLDIIMNAIPHYSHLELLLKSYSHPLNLG